MKLLLTSNGFFTDETKNKFLKLIKGQKETKRVTIATTASPQKHNNMFAIKAAII